MFEEEGEMDETDNEGQREKGEVATSDNEFGNRWRWIALIDRVSETVRDSWEKVFAMNIYEFFNILCYSIDKSNEEKRQLENWKRKH